MTTSSATSSIEIDAPVEKVFAFVSDPVKTMQAFPGPNVTVSDVETTPEGAVTSWKWTAQLPLLHYNLHAVVTREEQIANQRIVDKNSTGPVETVTFEPSGNGTRLTTSWELASRIPLLDKVEVFVATSGEGMKSQLDEYLAEIKQQLEA